MELLPVELLRLIFECCDAASIRTLRLVSRYLAEIGYEYLLPPHFDAVEWRDDIKTLHSIASHDRLSSSIRSITFNFSKVDEYHARHASFFQHWLQEPEERSVILQHAWTQYSELEERSRSLPVFHARSGMLEESFKRLSNLKELEITYTKCPYDIEVLKEVFLVRNCRKRDRVQACKNMNAMVSAIRHVQLSSLSIDQLPLEIFRQADDRLHWFDCARSFASLSRLDLVLDPPTALLPQGLARSINALGRVLQLSPNLEHLYLGVHNYRSPLEKFRLSFHALLGDFTYEKLTDLKLEGLTLEEEDLRAFLVRHGKTLERLRIGGRGLAKPHELSMGGVHLHRGTFRSLFTSLQGRLPVLKRFHLEGDIEAGDIMTSSRELYRFHAVTDDNWDRIATRSARKTIDCLALEKYLLEGGPYPSLGAPGR
ncbi:hypothetical protein QBC34DRAFT_448421 [Podospora aff. communis PSN243]|uniref:F-box domain-containing protein n=1 Tax=Podospora aff. communis PSN243 TaxID=3040156 RepID=A0AAV9GMF6_9PEZI|nr:hypothetical protein QBC34DRAFT_448421 [Podospora aff. communis PSN243]